MPMLHSPPPMCFTLLSLIIILRSNAAPLTPPTATQYGIMIDAGSGGSRAHLFEWKTRRVSELPPPLSYPVTNVAWTEKVKPGLSAYWQYPKSVKTVLNVLLEWVKSRLAHVKQWWGYYPIYLKATAGLRELPAEPRKKLIAVIRDFFLNNSTCPFYFEEFDAARVISGEEEAAYAWTAINYATGALLKYSWGSGTASPLNAYGSLELGGASAQIAFYDSNEDILANLFKVQVGQQRHWNIYAHSFLHYGQNSARRRMWGKLAEDVGCYKEKEFKKLQENGKACSIRDYCLPKGYVYPPYLVPASSDGEAGVPPPFGILERPKHMVHVFAQRAGVYQPPLPYEKGPFGKFFLFGGYHDIWSFLNLSSTSTLREFKKRGEMICNMDFVQLTKYNIALGGGEGASEKRVGVGVDVDVDGSDKRRPLID
eukprot:jgi/Bigna1/84448/fgenesh1_pg.139_\